MKTPRRMQGHHNTTVECKNEKLKINNLKCRVNTNKTIMKSVSHCILQHTRIDHHIIK